MQKRTLLYHHNTRSKTAEYWLFYYSILKDKGGFAYETQMSCGSSYPMSWHSGFLILEYVYDCFRSCCLKCRKVTAVIMTLTTSVMTAMMKEVPTEAEDIHQMTLQQIQAQTEMYRWEPQIDYRNLCWLSLPFTIDGRVGRRICRKMLPKRQLLERLELRQYSKRLNIFDPAGFGAHHCLPRHLWPWRPADPVQHPCPEVGAERQTNKKNRIQDSQRRMAGAFHKQGINDKEALLEARHKVNHTLSGKKQF